MIDESTCRKDKSVLRNGYLRCPGVIEQQPVNGSNINISVSIYTKRDVWIWLTRNFGRNTERGCSICCFDSWETLYDEEEKKDSKSELKIVNTHGLFFFL